MEPANPRVVWEGGGERTEEDDEVNGAVRVTAGTNEMLKTTQGPVVIKIFYFFKVRWLS